MDLDSVPSTGSGSLRSEHRSGVIPGEGARAARMPSRNCDIRLSLPARAENVAVVRHVVGALAEALELPQRMVEDVKLAVTEACTNVVRHAYRDADGPIEVRVQPAGDELTVVVADRGRGLAPNPDSEGPGLGLPLIAALSDALEIDHSPSSGSRLCMSFRASGRRILEVA